MDTSTDLGELTEAELEIVKETSEEDLAYEEGEGTEDTEGSAPDLAAQLSELEASNKGLVKALTAQRGIRQELQGQLDEIKEAISSVKATKSEVRTPISSTSAIPIDFDDEGNPFLDPTKLSVLYSRSPELDAIQKELSFIRQTTALTKQHVAEQEKLKSLLSEDESFTPAYQKVTDAWNYLKDDLFDKFLIEKGLPAPTTAEAAIELAVSSQELTSAFEKKFPGVDMESVLEAHLIATPRYLRKALKRVSGPTKTRSNQPMDFNRPASLATANTSGGENQESLLSRIADMSNDDFMALDKKTMAKIDRLLAVKG